MRRGTQIEKLWRQGGPFIGDKGRPNGIVTVQPDWYLHTHYDHAWINRRNPVRYFQHVDNNQTEVQVPNLLSIAIDRSIESDAATATITVLNVFAENNLRGSQPLATRGGAEWGQPGALNFNYGDKFSKWRWGNLQNGWQQKQGHTQFGPDDGTPASPGTWLHTHKALLPGALLRTYQGYGGNNKSRADALADGNIVITGVWIVDSISPGSDGKLTIVARDMASLLIDQIWYPPLIPPGSYPTRFWTGERANYHDLSDIVKCILLWSGFHLKGAHPLPPTPGNPRWFPAVYGNIEACGFVPPEPVKEDVFDKKAPIDAINTIKEIVGFLAFVDPEGAFHFQSPNWWEAGNFWQDTGAHTDLIPEIDERVNMTAYTPTTSKTNERSAIIVASSEPTLNLGDTKVANYHMGAHRNVTYLRGMSVPTMVPMPFDVPLKEMKTMGELIGLHIWFARRTGQVSCVANPLIDIDDQVQLWHEASSESFIHYVRGVQTNMDLETGEYSMTLTTHWLGTANEWCIVTDSRGGVYYTNVPDEHYGVSDETKRRATSHRGITHVYEPIDPPPTPVAT